MQLFDEVIVLPMDELNLQSLKQCGNSEQDGDYKPNVLVIVSVPGQSMTAEYRRSGDKGHLKLSIDFSSNEELQMLLDNLTVLAEVCPGFSIEICMLDDITPDIDVPDGVIVK